MSDLCTIDCLFSQTHFKEILVYFNFRNSTSTFYVQNVLNSVSWTQSNASFSKAYFISVVPVLLKKAVLTSEYWALTYFIAVCGYSWYNYMLPNLQNKSNMVCLYVFLLSWIFKKIKLVTTLSWPMERKAKMINENTQVSGSFIFNTRMHTRAHKHTNTHTHIASQNTHINATSNNFFDCKYRVHCHGGSKGKISLYILPKQQVVESEGHK